MNIIDQFYLEAKENKELNKALKSMSKKEKEDAFNGEIEFGTAGLRGLMGIGTNRLNIYTIRKTTLGFGKYLLKTYKSDCYRGVCIAYDNRLNSREFALEAAMVLGSIGIKVLMFESLRPTPELSFSILYKKAIAGIMITASHNPKEYNGYKVYNEFGYQLTPNDADLITEEIKKIDNMFEINTVPIKTLTDSGLFEYLGSDIDDAFLDKAKTVFLHNNLEKKIKICYSPLHGTGSEIGKRALLENGFDASFVKEQMKNCSDFKTIKYPNPESKDAFALLEKLGKRVNADLLIATDPDADRVGIGVLHNKEYVYLTGNETGALLLNYRLSSLKKSKKLPPKGIIYDTIVTSELGRQIAKRFKVETKSLLTGFKYIGEQSKLIEKTDYTYLFGYEESYGYLIKDYARDKDSIQSLLSISEMANFYKVKESKDLVEVLEDIHNKYGYYQDKVLNFEFPGSGGKAIMYNICAHFRNEDIKEINNQKVLMKEDYKTSIRTNYINAFEDQITLPKSNVIKYYLEDNSTVIIRPSGTEPKLKVYLSYRGNDLNDALVNISNLEKAISTIIKEIK